MNIKPFFQRLSAPLVLAGALSGCATTIHTNLDTCETTSRSVFKSVAANPLNEKDEDGNDPLIALPENKAHFERRVNLGFNPSCDSAFKFVRIGMIKDKAGNYNLDAVQILLMYIHDEKTSSEVKEQIALRLKKDHGMTFLDLHKLEERLRIQKFGPTEFICRNTPEGRRCKEELISPATPPAVK